MLRSDMLWVRILKEELRRLPPPRTAVLKNFHLGGGGIKEKLPSVKDNTSAHL